MNQEPCRYSLISHPPESSVVLDLMSEAADLLVEGRITDAYEKIKQANSDSLRHWFHYKAQRSSDRLSEHGIEVSYPPKTLPAKHGRPTKKVEHRIFERDNWHCRFCGIRVIDRRVRTIMSRLIPDKQLLRGRGNLKRHACYVVSTSLDHVLPRSWGGTNDESNLVTACWPCQFSRMENRIDECRIFDPRDREPIQSNWDGLLRVKRAKKS